jgi:hypothetical protein
MQVAHASDIFLGKKPIIPKSIVRIKLFAKISIENLAKQSSRDFGDMTEDEFFRQHFTKSRGHSIAQLH